MTTPTATYDPGSSHGAINVATALLTIGHRIDLGLMQINYDAWLKPARFSIEQAFDPCTNIRLGTTILSANYAHALARSGTSREALYRALSQYNSGSDFAAWDYADRVLNRRPSIPIFRPGF